MGKGAAALGAWTLLTGLSGAGELQVTVEELRSTDGLLQICVTRDEAHFPNCENDPQAVRRSISADTGTLTVTGLPSGDYAIAILHDENANSRLDRFAGIPREGIGFSRNPRFSFGPPRFSAASFRVDGSGSEQRITIRYFI